MKKKLLFFPQKFATCVPIMSNEVDTCKRDFSVFTKKNFQGTILDGGSYIENLKIERQPSKKYPIFNTNQFSIDDIYQI
jgi:hypothetical protein